MMTAIPLSAAGMPYSVNTVTRTMSREPTDKLVDDDEEVQIDAKHN